MKAIVFAAGIGSRLKPFTDHHPKALAPVAGVPAIQRVVEKLVKAGADTVFVNVHHFASQICDFLDSHNFGVPVVVSDESGWLLDTGGGLAKFWREQALLRSLPDDETIIVHNSDIITDFPISELAAAEGDAAILVDGKRVSTRGFLFDSQGRLRGWHNTAKGLVRPQDLNTEGLRAAAFGGVHRVTPKVLKQISDYAGDGLHPFSIVDFYLDNCNLLDIRAFEPHKSYNWFDIGTPDKLATATAALEGMNKA